MRRLLTPALLVFLGCTLAVAAPARSQAEPTFSDVVIFATNSAHLSRSVGVDSGDVVVNDSASGLTLGKGVELSLDRLASVAAGVWADSIALDVGASVGSSQCNTGAGVDCDGLALPVFPPPQVPVFQQATLRDGAPDVTVATGGTVVLDAGDYADVIVGSGGTVVFTGGIYNIGSIQASTTSPGPCPFPCRSLIFEAPSELRILGVFDSGTDSYVGPAAGATSASRIILYVGGTNLVANDPNSFPPAARVGQRSLVEANFYVPQGTFLLERQSSATGAFLARDVEIDRESAVDLASFYNPPPTADPQEVATTGTEPLAITLTGSDPENEPLTFEIVSSPAAGTVTDPVPASPSSATVTYVASPPGDLQDSFVFRVTDRNGGFDEAVVLINPDDSGGGPPPPSNTVIAYDAAFEVAADMASDLTLSAVADVEFPELIGDFEFSIVSGPDSGSLTEPVVSGSTAAVTYTPDPGFEGSDSFVFEACADLDAFGYQCDTATVVLQVVVATSPPPTARDLKATTLIDTPIVITLTGDAGDGEPPPGGGRSMALPEGLSATPAAVRTGGAEKVAGMNLTVTAFSAPAQAERGEVVGDRIQVTVTNNGDVDIPAGTAAAIGFYVSTDDLITTGDTLLTGGRENLLSSAPDGLPSGASISDFLFAGASINTASPEGDVWIGVLVDEFNDLEEGDETDNTASQPIRIGAPLPDLVIASLTHAPAAPGAETTITFTAEVQNVGAAEAGASTLCFEIGGESCASSPGTLFAVPSLGPGQSFAVSRSAQLPPATYQNTAVADYAGEIVESDETNNAATDTYVVSADTSPAVFTIVSLPLHGTLFSASGAVVAAVPTDLTNPNVTYLPAVGYAGSDLFQYAPAGFPEIVARVDLRVISPSGVTGCLTDPAACDDGRP